LGRLEVEVSYDDGGSWRRLPFLGIGLNRLALVAHPAVGRIRVATRPRHGR